MSADEATFLDWVPEDWVDEPDRDAFMTVLIRRRIERQGFVMQGEPSFEWLDLNDPKNAFLAETFPMRVNGRQPRWLVRTRAPLPTPGSAGLRP